MSAGGRLDQPLTYWNAMGALAAIGLVLSARIAGDRLRLDAVRALAAGAAVPMALALYLTYSRGALAAAGCGLLVLALLAPTFAQVRSIVFVVGGGGVACIVASQLDGVASLKGTMGHREAQGVLMLSVLVAVMIAVAALEAYACRAEREGRARTGAMPLPSWVRPAGFVVAICVALLPYALAVVSERGQDNPSFGASAQRLTSTGSNRYAYWRVALRTWADHPLQGAGAAAFRVEWLRERPFRESVRDAHSLYFETLAELGLVGFVLLCALLAGVLLAARKVLAADAALAAGPAAGLVVWAVHAGVDWDWEMPALTLVAVTLAGLLLACSRRSAHPAAERDRGEQHERDLRRIAEARGAVADRGRDGHEQNRRQQNQQGRAAASSATGRKRQQQPVGGQAGLLDPHPAALVVEHHPPWLEEVPCAQQANGHHRGRARGVVARVVLAELAPHAHLGRLVVERPLGYALDVPEARVDAVVGEPAVGAGEQRAVVVRYRHEVVEHHRVADHSPRRQHQHACAGGGGEAQPASRPGPERHRQGQQQHQQQPLAAGETPRERSPRPARPPSRCRGARRACRPAASRPPRSARTGSRSMGRAVGADQHRIDGGDAGLRRDRRAFLRCASRAARSARSCRYPPRNPRRVARALPFRPATRPRTGVLPQRRVPRALQAAAVEHVLERVNEPVPVRQQVGAPVEEVPVADALDGPREHEHVDEAQDQSDRGDQQQPRAEAGASQRHRLRHSLSRRHGRSTT